MSRGLRSTVRSQAGLTLVETMVAAALLLVGLLGTVKLIDVASSSQGDAKAREGATNLAREVLEDAHDTAFKQVGATGWITPSLQTLANDTNSTNTVTTPTSSSAQTTLTRRKIPYTVNVSWCSVDDSKDGYGTHSGSINWCSDSTTTGTGDSAPEDLKRVTAAITYSINGNAKTLSETVTFSATGGMVAPSVQSLCASGTPIGAGTNCTGPWTITDGTATTQSFIGTAPGAADMKFAVNGVEVTSGVTNNGDGTWTYAWPIALASVPDGTYTISATAVDALGNRSTPMSQTVKLARGSTVTVANVQGGYNYVNPPGLGNGGSLAVELQWDASGAGSVTGYEVLRGATSVCGGQTSLANTCIDTSPPTTGTTAYTIKTWYQDANGNAASVSTTYNVTAPATLPTQYWWATTTAISQTNCAAPAISGAKKDLPSTAPAGADTAWTNGAGGSTLVGCMAPFTVAANLSAGANNITVSGWFKNTISTACGLQVELYKNGALAGVGNAYNFSAAYWTIPGNTGTTTQFTETLNTAAVSFASGDQISVVIGGFSNNSSNPANKCLSTTMYYNSSTHPLTITLPLTAAASLQVPNVPTGLSVVANADGTRTLNWTAPTSDAAHPAPDFYRIYRDGTATSARIDTADAVNTTVSTASSAGATTLTVAGVSGYSAGQTLLVDTGTNQDTMTISSINTSTNTITFTAGMTHAHAVNVPVVLRAVSFTDTTASSSHTYRITAVSPNLGESSFAGPVTG